MSFRSFSLYFTLIALLLELLDASAPFVRADARFTGVAFATVLKQTKATRIAADKKVACGETQVNEIIDALQGSENDDDGGDHDGSEMSSSHCSVLAQSPAFVHRVPLSRVVCFVYDCLALDSQPRGDIEPPSHLSA